jgi:DNA mismatch endonuclease (patch repair protein)
VTDTVSRERRSENMRRIRSKDMQPELIVRSLVYRLGARFRLQAKELPGKPDIVRRLHKQAIFVHGCFWHQHSGPTCLDGRLPKSNKAYWVPKLARNVQRDKDAVAALLKMGWKVLIVWECETKKPAKLERKLRKFLAAA